MLIPMDQASGQFLVLNEYFYDQTGSLEWVEVFNPDIEPVAISGWYFGLPGELETIPDFEVGPQSYALIYPTQEIRIPSQAG